MQRLLGIELDVAGFKALEGGISLGRERFGGTGVDDQGAVKGTIGGGLVVLLLVKAARLVIGPPEILVLFGRLPPDIGENKLELIGNAVIAGSFAAGQTDQVQRLRIGYFHIIIGPLRIRPDEPAKLLVGLVGLAAVAIDSAQGPARQEMLFGQAQGFPCGFFRPVPLPAIIEHFSAAGEQVGVLRQVLEGIVHDAQRLFVVTLALIRLADADGAGGSGLGVFQKRLHSSRGPRRNCRARAPAGPP